ncbi:MAG: DUF916 domain-containing protein, partial [Microbacteriaceae bacterium]|nr:DUF916 domain-containing protein [Microbacteriaceae bacterium]
GTGSAFAASPTPSSSAKAKEPAAAGLQLLPLGAFRGYFQLDMVPGQTRTVSVSRNNAGTEPVDARTYLANVYSVANGGFGADLSSATATGTTSWLSYATETLHLAPGAKNVHTITVTVPATATPGDYLTSVVLESTTPRPASTGAIQINQVLRHALAVSIHVPGPYTPSFTLGHISYHDSHDHAVVDVAVENTGNENLNPAGTLTIQDDKHTVVAKTVITMASVYAHTAAAAETTFDTTLQPGQYTLTMVLKDAHTGITETATNIPFTVAAPPAPLALNQATAQLPRIIQKIKSTPYLLIAAMISAILLALAAIVLILVRRHRRRAATTES